MELYFGHDLQKTMVFAELLAKSVHHIDYQKLGIFVSRIYGRIRLHRDTETLGIDAGVTMLTLQCLQHEQLALFHVLNSPRKYAV